MFYINAPSFFILKLLLMLYALNKHGEKIRPYIGARGRCPFCKETVIAKCGLINVDHWAHEAKSRSVCVSGEYESETEWHYTYKGLFPKHCVEVTVEKLGRLKRADIKLPNGLVLEIQHSSINAKVIRERNAFHGDIAWLFDASGPFADGRIHYYGMDGLGEITNFSGKYEWIQPRKSIRYAGGEENNPVFIDIGFGKILELDKVWFGMYQKDTEDSEKYGQYTIKYCLTGKAKAYRNFEEFVQRISELDTQILFKKKKRKRKHRQRKPQTNVDQISFLDH